MKIFVKSSCSVAISSWYIYISGSGKDKKRNVGKFFGDTYHKLVCDQLCKIQ